MVPQFAQTGRPVFAALMLMSLLTSACDGVTAPVPQAPRATGCRSDRDCPSALCDKTDDGDAIPAAEDEFGICTVDECSDQQPCDDDLVCSDFFCRSACEPPAVRGEACFFTSDVPRCEPMTKPCAGQFICDVVDTGFGGEGECVPPLDRELDEVCHGEVCAPGLRCDEEAQRCSVR